jgi:hypothetical protein
MAIAGGSAALLSTTTVLRVPMATNEPELSTDAMASSGTPVEGAVEAQERDPVREGGAPGPKRERERPTGRWKGDGPQS